MIFDLLSTDMYVSYNFNLANIIGLKEAIYISELININRKAIVKNKLTDDFFKVDRKYITERTTLTEKEQKEIDKSLSSINIITIGSSADFLKVNTDSLTGLMLEKDKKIIDTISNDVKKSTKSTKKEVISANLKSNVQTANEELRNAFYDWIDAVLSRQGWMSKKSIINGQQVLDTYTKRDLDLALSILDIASINGWRDLNWAIDEFEKRKKKSYFTLPNTPTNLDNSKQVSFSNDEVF